MNDCILIFLHSTVKSISPKCISKEIGYGKILQITMERNKSKENVGPSKLLNSYLWASSAVWRTQYPSLYAMTNTLKCVLGARGKMGYIWCWIVGWDCVNGWVLLTYKLHIGEKERERIQKVFLVVWKYVYTQEIFCTYGSGIHSPYMSMKNQICVLYWDCNKVLNNILISSCCG